MVGSDHHCRVRQLVHREAPGASIFGVIVIASDLTPERAAYLGSLRAARPILASDALEERWEEESALDGFSVKGLAGHLVRAGQAPLLYLEQPAPDPDSVVTAPTYYRTVLDAMGPAEHAEVIDRGEANAAIGAARLLAEHDAAIAALEARLPEIDPAQPIAVYMGVPMRFDHYLVVRICEVLIHTDDLAVSLELDPPELPREVAGFAIEHLVDVARLWYGDRAVLIALSRRERDEVDALRIFKEAVR
ncbi:MAG: maleylpyruvate isomerase N-terminal domain-containing protein [Actinomycetota bacterium]|nr:maleylpyruvate isomerase N-terminal domain-containing protein [Actinomycetota bacterium]